MQTIKQLDEQFSIPSTLRFEQVEGGLVRAVISAADAGGVVYLQGAHVSSWIPKGKRPVLFTSARSEFLPGKAIRGGVPVIFPWFGPRGGGIAGPSHGFARVAVWRLTAAEKSDGGVGLLLELEADDVADRFGYENFTLKFRVRLGAELDMELQVRNHGPKPLTFEEALHSYFAVSDIEQVQVSGLIGTTYIDKTDLLKRKQAGEAMQIEKETDQVHLNTQAACVIEDSGWQRRIVIEKTGSNSTIVWNPWIGKTKALKDMRPDEWRQMICVESGNVADDAVTLAPGQAHVLQAAIRFGN